MGVLRTTATHSRALSPLLKLRARSQPMTTRSLRMLLRRHLDGLTPTFPQRRKNLKKSRSPSRALQCQSFSPWLEQLVVLQEVCQVECLVLAVCLTSVLLVEPVLLLLMILLLDRPSRRLTKVLESI